MSVVRRGYVDTDSKEFSKEKLLLLKMAQEDVFWLLNRGYQIKKVMEFVGNHYLLSARQRLAIMRATSSTILIEERKNKKISVFDNKTINIDGFNLIITLEVALSGSTLIKCMDGTIRDLAELRNSYRLIDKTDKAIAIIGDKLQAMNISHAVFYLDRFVSNTGRLKIRILELLDSFSFHTSVEIVDNADYFLKEKSYVITTDSIILNECISWINLVSEIIYSSAYGLEEVKESLICLDG